MDLRRRLSNGAGGRLGHQQGVTLVELMMALAVVTIVVGAGFGILIASEKATHTSGQIVDAQQSVRLAMDLLSRDIKMAGFGWQAGMSVGNCLVPPVGPPAPIVPIDNNPVAGDTGPDGISMVVPMTNSQAGTGSVWALAAPVTGAFSSVQLQAGAVAAMTAAGLGPAPGATSTVISIGGAYAVQVTGTAGPNGLQLATTAPGHMAFPAGTPVYLLQCITYTVANNQAQCGNLAAPCLLRGPVGPGGLPNQQVAIADGIEDMQLAYACDGCTAADTIGNGLIDEGDATVGFSDGDFMTNVAWTLAPRTPIRIRLVQVNLVARQTARSGDQGFGEGNSSAQLTPTPLVVSDHNHALGVFAAGDMAVQTPPYASVRRRVLTKTVATRNVGLCSVC